MDDQPYFFLSYAHTPKRDQGDQTDPDYWVSQLFDDLCRHMREMLALPQDTGLGFMDRELRPGNEWPGKLDSALAACRVFVPLYSRRYFASVHCGKEWSAFTLRMSRYHGTDRERFIVPALWVPLHAPLPSMAARYESADFGRVYAELGFYGIMKLSRYRDEYDTAVHRLARQIIEAGDGAPHRSPLPLGPVERYDELDSAFDTAYPTGDSERRVLVTVAAADAASLPSDIPRTQYGASGREWTPYFEESNRPLAQQAADIATTLGYLPEVGELAEHADELVSDAPPTRATVLLVDPRAVTVAESRKTLQRIDGASKPISVVVIWNPKAFTVGEEADLRDALAAALPHKLVEGRATSVLAIKGVPTLADFGTVVPVVLRAAERSFLRFAPAPGVHDAPGK